MRVYHPAALHLLEIRATGYKPISELIYIQCLCAALAPLVRRHNEQALDSLKLKKSVDAEGGRTLAVMIEGG